MQIGSTQNFLNQAPQAATVAGVKTDSPGKNASSALHVAKEEASQPPVTAQAPRQGKGSLVNILA